MHRNTSQRSGLPQDCSWIFRKRPGGRGFHAERRTSLEISPGRGQISRWRERETIDWTEIRLCSTIFEFRRATNSRIIKGIESWNRSALFVIVRSFYDLLFEWNGNGEIPIQFPANIFYHSKIGAPCKSRSNRWKSAPFFIRLVSSYYCEHVLLIPRLKLYRDEICKMGTSE